MSATPEGLVSAPRADSPRRAGYVRGQWIDGRYQLLAPLGEGGMGSVWAAHNHTLDVQVALKLVRPPFASVKLEERLLREARAAARVAHSAVVRVFELGITDDGERFIAMELLEGEPLHRRVERDGPLSPVEAVRTLLPIADGLAEAHRQGIIHRDVKPDNVFLATMSDGRVQPKLFDFGVAKLRAGGEALTMAGMTVGTPQYLAPEQARGDDDVDLRADVWAFAVTLYETMTGQYPFDGDDTAEVLRAIVKEEPPPLTTLCTADDDLWVIVARGLAKNRDARWPSLDQFQAALSRWLVRRGVSSDVTGAALQTADAPPPPSSPADERSTLRSSQRPLGPGSVVGGRYRLVDKIGDGGASVVFSAVQLDLDRPVAVKILTASPNGDERHADRLHREAKLIAGIRHPGITEVYETTVDDDGTHFIAMELLEGETVRELLNRQRVLEPDDAIDIAVSACDALAAVHERGYVHRDVKPANMFLVRRADGRWLVKLVDFGTARPVDVSSAQSDAVAKKTLSRLPASLTLPGIVLGTPRYMSPEQITGDNLGSRSDVYGLGCVLYEMVTGFAVFEDGDAGRLIARHLAEAPMAPKRRAPDREISAALERVILRCLAKEPHQRFGSARELAAALDDARQGVAPPPALPNHRTARVVATAAGLLVLFVSGFLLLRTTAGPRSAPPAAPAPAPVVEVPDPQLPQIAVTPAASPEATASVATPLPRVSRSKSPGAARTPKAPQEAPSAPTPAGVSSPDYRLRELKDLAKETP